MSVLELMGSAILLFDLVAALFLVLYFALGKPRTWYRDRLGWVIFSYAIAVVALLAVIVWGVVLRHSVTPLVVVIVAGALGAALVAKIVAVYRERREGRRAGTRPHLSRKEDHDRQQA